MLHVRDQLSLSCRKYQAARQHDKDQQIPPHSEVRSTCVDALRWTCRYLPFSRFLNADEICQDMVLSLVSELPPVSLVADTVAQAFPEEEESVRVPLREKYNSLLQTLRQCDVLEENEDGKEPMMILIQDKLRQRRKHLSRLQRHLGPLELHLWEKEMDEDEWGSKHGMAMLRQLSLGTSLSTSTLTDCGFPPVYSDGDTIENISEAPLSPKQHKRPTTRGKKAQMLHRGEAQNISVRIESVIKEESHSGDTKDKDSHLKSKQPSLPVVGTWEFELEDEEYLNFLQVFLSYVLEKDFADGVNTSNELPLLKDFSLKLRERELHSLTFDVLTTMHRRQRDKHHQSRRKSTTEPPVFRAGCCFRQMKQAPTPLTSSVISEAHTSRGSLSEDFLSDLKAGGQKGLFGPQKNSSGFLHQRTKPSHLGSKTSPIRSAVSTEQWSSCWFGSSASVDSMMELQRGLDPKLDAQFPELGRLLEWTVRWADRRGPLGHHGQKRERGEGAADGGVVLRVKASVPAVLMSLSLTERRYSALFRTDRCTAHIHGPQTHWVVAPVLGPAGDGNVERESGVDRSNPEPTNCPVTVHDHSPQPQVSIVSPADEADEQATPTTHVQDDSLQTSETPIRTSATQQPLLDDLDVTPEKEGKSCHSDVPDDSSSVSSGNSCTPQTSLKLADLNISESMSISALVYQKTTAHGQIQPLPAAQPEPVVHGSSDPPEVQLSNIPADCPSLDPHSSTAAGPTTVPSAAGQPSCSPQAPQIRRLGEDLFRLVQNINYISLMEVLDTSFSNLHLAQQNSSVAQSNINPLNSNVTFPHARSFVPSLNSVPVQTDASVVPQTQTSVPNSGSERIQFSRAPPCTHVLQPSTSYQHHTTRNLPPAGSGASAPGQEMQPLSVQAESPAVQFRESRSLIPCSQGLLTTTDTSHVVHSVPAVAPSNGSVQSEPVALVSGLKLLQLHPPRLPQQSASHYFPVQQTPNPAAKESSQSKPKVSGQTGASVPRRQLDFNRDSTHNVPPRSSQLQNQMSERSKAQELPLFSPGFLVHTPSNPQGLRLLHFEPDSRSNVMFPKLPTQASSRPLPALVLPMGETQKIKLLHIESQPKMMCPPAASSAQIAPLIPLEELAYSVKMQNVDEAQFQLLQVHRPPESTKTTAAPLTSGSSKRLKRREKAQKAEVTFKPNVSIIPTREPSDEPPTLEEITDGPDVVRTLGSSVTGQTLVDKAMSTAAELHAFASTCKRPPECHDAFTNTDPACPPALVYKAVSVQTSVNAVPNFRNQQVDGDSAVGSKKEEMSLCVDGRQFLSVLDLEDRSLHQDLPPSLTLSPQTRNPPLLPASPTSASLHVLATSVLTAASATAVHADLQTSVDCPEDLLRPSTRPDSPEDSASLSPSENGGEAEGVTADQSNSEVCKALKAQRVESCRTLSTLPPHWFSSGLSELDSQLAALQNIADGLEKDFSNSRMLVNAIEKLPPVLASDVRTTTVLRKTVRLSVPHEAWTPQLHTLIEPNACEDEEEEEEEEEEGHVPVDSRAASVYSSKPGPSRLPSAPKFTEQSCEVNGISDTWAEENLGQSELSDTAEILDQLVREGYISQSDLDLSTSHTDERWRLEEHQSSWMSQEPVLPEDERRELRIWMRRKQRERLAVYQKHRDALREREHRPFGSSGAERSTTKNLKTVWRTREEKEKVKLLEQYTHRTLEACSLAAGPPLTPGSFKADRPMMLLGAPPTTAPPTTAPPPNSTYRVSSAPVSDARSLDCQLPPRSWTAEVQGWPSEEHRRRLGLHRPVTSLPKDRLSQVTRRGMVTDSNRGGNVHIRRPRTTALSSSPSAVRRGIQKKKDQTPMEQWWKPSAEPWRHLGAEEGHSRIPAGALDPQADSPAAGVSGWDWLDHLSDSAGSSLSKIDWAAIERMVADEES